MRLLARMMAANLYYNQIENLMFEASCSTRYSFFQLSQDSIDLFIFSSWQLSMWRCTDEFRVAADVIHRNSRKDAAKHYIGLNHKTFMQIYFSFLARS